ncbi:SCAN domain-containing protein 3 [Trichonephila clavipes]|nr:SCAN domain-containing protein 3 [Trichonephila clavipes]
MFGGNFAKELQSIPLSNDTVSRRIDDIAEDVEQQLFGKLRDKLFSIQLDEATDSNKDAHFIAYVRFWDASKDAYREPIPLDFLHKADNILNKPFPIFEIHRSVKLSKNSTPGADPITASFLKKLDHSGCEVRLRESVHPVGRLRKTCKNAFPRTIPVSFGRLDTSIATKSS